MDVSQSVFLNGQVHSAHNWAGVVKFEEMPVYHNLAAPYVEVSFFPSQHYGIWVDFVGFVAAIANMDNY